MATHWTLGCDAADPHAIAAFWARALGYIAEPGYDDPDGVGPAISFLRVPEAKTAKNRMHIDIRVAGEPPWNMPERERLIRTKVAELACVEGETIHNEPFEVCPEMVVDAMINRDLPLMQGLVLTFAVVFIALNLLIDLLITWLDPRLQHG